MLMQHLAYLDTNNIIKSAKGHRVGSTGYKEQKRCISHLILSLQYLQIYSHHKIFWYGAALLHMH